PHQRERDAADEPVLGSWERKLPQLVVASSTWKPGELAVRLRAPLDSILVEVGKALNRLGGCCDGGREG
ncbi:MAG: hypothetical protein ACYDB4_13115, partial [Candidatus Dormibacteraceae bacterium]